MENELERYEKDKQELAIAFQCLCGRKLSGFSGRTFHCANCKRFYAVGIVLIGTVEDGNALGTS